MPGRHSWPVAIVMLLLWTVPALAAPQHVVSTSLCTDEYVFRLLPRERIAALSVLAGDTHPVVSTIADRVKGMALIRPSAETVLAKHPDLVVMYEGTDPRLRAQLRQAGVKVLEVPWANSLAEVRKVTLMLGGKLGVPARARELVNAMDTRLAAARTVAATPPVSAVIYEPNGYVTADSLSNEILAQAGLRNVAGRMHPTRMRTLPVETVVASAPELLILNAPRETTPARADLVLQNPALASLQGRSLIVHAALMPLLCPGPWSVDVAGELARMGQEARALAARRAAH
ncbi:MAG: ABC transporter substrate-binding protein [Alphaproteobacteria bacterium]|nr:ABC transporter substrate-binding protein [Alphaproteobacteria bacterium]MBU6472354.1 ABC transporter substrate-binding protein [Alphaproteobacteria bacterium]MDE2014272.1 ABC transporter substrate-binding protein [Alphaproteobacteria bacterium]MDE2072607.1 ABC transporter substrate-binding protein [Alphaproteobacteria bacterium]